ncbi:hypothetical protein D9757_004508 [Collybiopsis confluens]|uniref:Uncharacterized protein n=1 Tax=Collybiopsis confluens TaxID=2823264 RepID=A0A8H5HWN1_9AGAR|nr:hypothetical protein D9757_004508 [Collybiopsis confluens]
MSTTLLQIGRNHRCINDQYQLTGALNGFMACPMCHLTYMTSHGYTRVCTLQRDMQLSETGTSIKFRTHRCSNPKCLRLRPSKNPRAHAFLDLYQLVGLTQDDVPGYIHVHHEIKTLMHKTGARKLTDAEQPVHAAKGRSFYSIIDASVPRDKAPLPTASWPIITPFVKPLEKNGLPVYWRIPNRSTGGFLTMMLQSCPWIRVAEGELHDLLLWMLAHKLIQSHGPQNTEQSGDDNDESEDDENKDETRPKKKVKIGSSGAHKGGKRGGSGRGGGSGGSGGGAGSGGGPNKGGGKGGGSGRRGRGEGGGRLLRSGAGTGSSTTENSRPATETDTGSTLASKTTSKGIRPFSSPQPPNF